MMSRRDPPIAETLARQLSELREAGLSDAAIGAASGIDRMTIWRFRNGHADQPRYRSVAAVEALYKAKIGSG